MNRPENYSRGQVAPPGLCCRRRCGFVGCFMLTTEGLVFPGGGELSKFLLKDERSEETCHGSMTVSHHCCVTAGRR